MNSLNLLKDEKPLLPSMLKSYLSCKITIFNEINEQKLKLNKIEISKMINSDLQKATNMKKSILNI